MKIKKVLSSIIVGALLAFGFGAQAQIPAPPVPDLSMLTNHAALVGYAFKQIKGIQVSASSAGQADNGTHGGFFAFTNQVASLYSLADVVSPYWWSVTLTSTNDYISLNAQFWNTNDINSVYGYNSDAYPLFYAYGGGQPIKVGYYWTLPDSATALNMYLAPQIRIPTPGVIDARLIIRDQYGNASGMQLNVQNGQTWFQSDYAGESELVLTSQVQDSNGYWYAVTKGYSLSNGMEMPLTSVQFNILLRDSEDFRASKDSTNIDVSVYSYQGYGKVPLVMPTYTKNATNVTLSVHSLDGQFATSYIVENQQTKVKTTNNVSAGATSLKLDFKAGDYQVIPLGIKLLIGSPYYYDGKG